MDKKIVIITLLSGLALPFLSSVSAFDFRKKSAQKKMPSLSIIDQLYVGIDGYNISEIERDKLNAQEANPTYGEITPDGIEKLREIVSPSQRDVFYDLGCGVGKACMQVAIFWPVKKVVGIELSPTRLNYAAQAKKRLSQVNYRLPRHKKLIFKEQNILNADLSDATIIFMNSTCYSDKLMESVVQKLAQLRDGVRIFSQKTLPKNPRLAFIETYSIPMTWSKNVSVHYYKTGK